MTAPIKTWTEGVPFESSAREQVKRLAELPVVGPHVAIMPDVHAGIGCVVGSVVPTRRAIIPAAVGVDIGCGMVAARTTMTASRLPDSLRELRLAIEANVPHGSAKGQPGVGSNLEPPLLWAHFAPGYESIVAKHPKIVAPQAGSQLGTLGGGNHFIEVCLDNGTPLGGGVVEEPHVWVMLHSGSRGVGNKIGTYFTEKARETALKLDRHLPDKDLAWLDEDTEDFKDYWQSLMWAQSYAKANRGIMLTGVLNTLMRILGPFGLTDGAVECHHNYCSFEEHFGEKLYVTRKGAVSAKKGELGIIPSNMGDRSFIVRGKGNADSFHSCSHGAGRVMSRGAAKKNITLEQHIEDTAGVECRKDAGMLDESKRAYKDVDAVMQAQSDLVDIVAVLKQVICVKG